MRPTKLKELRASGSPQDFSMGASAEAFHSMLKSLSRSGISAAALRDGVAARRAADCGRSRLRPHAAATRRARRRTMVHRASTRCAAAGKRASAAGEHGPRRAGMHGGFGFA